MPGGCCTIGLHAMHRRLLRRLLARLRHMGGLRILRPSHSGRRHALLRLGWVKVARPPAGIAGGKVVCPAGAEIVDIPGCGGCWNAAAYRVAVAGMMEAYRVVIGNAEPCPARFAGGKAAYPAVAVAGMAAACPPYPAPAYRGCTKLALALHTGRHPVRHPWPEGSTRLLE